MCSALGFLPCLTHYFSSACLDPSLSLNTSIFPYEKNGNRGIKDDVSEGKRNIFFWMHRASYTWLMLSHFENGHLDEISSFSRLGV
jgi:hypothetical protein